MKKRVTGIGGIFFKTKNQLEMRKWYAKHLGIESEDWGAVFPWREVDNPEKEGYTAWSLFKDDTKYLEPSDKEYMINYRVENLMELINILKEEGVTVMDQTEESEFGKFAWIIDPEGNKIELWEPPS